MRQADVILMVVLGVVAIGYGSLKRQMQLRNGSGIRRGWPSVLARGWFILIGIILLLLGVRESLKVR